MMKNEDQLRKRIHSFLRKVDKNLVQRMYEHLYRKFDAVGRTALKLDKIFFCSFRFLSLIIFLRALVKLKRN